MESKKKSSKKTNSPKKKEIKKEVPVRSLLDNLMEENYKAIIKNKNIKKNKPKPFNSPDPKKSE